MNLQASGSRFSESSIKKLKQFSLHLDAYLVLKNLRLLNFNKDKKIFIDLKTLLPIEIKNESQCVIVAYYERYAIVTVGSFTFLVKKSNIKKRKK